MMRRVLLSVRAVTVGTVPDDEIWDWHGPPVRTQPPSQTTEGDTASVPGVEPVPGVNTRFCAVSEPQELIGW